MSSRHSDCLSRLVRFCGVVGSNFGEPKIIRSHALKLLSTLLEVDSANMSVLELDAFGLLVAFTFSLPSLFNEHQGGAHSTDFLHFKTFRGWQFRHSSSSGGSSGYERGFLKASLASLGCRSAQRPVKLSE